MRKLRLLFASMFALLAWNGAFAQTDEEYNAAQAALENGKSYLISTVYDGTTYYLDVNGYLTDVKDEAGVFEFKAVTGGAYVPSAWWVGNSAFSNPPEGGNPTLTTGKISQYGDSMREDWEAQVFFLNSEGKYAVRCTNAAAGDSGWNLNGSCFWTVNEGPVAEYALEANFVWEVNEFVDERLPLFATVSAWLPRLQNATGLVQDPAQYSSNATEPSEGSIADLLDGEYTTFFHSMWSVAGPDEDHYLQAELPEAVNAFRFYFKKRSQNNNNRPTEIVISASNDGENFTEITSVTDGLPTDASIIDFISEEIELDQAYKFIRFSVPTTNNGATHSESTHVFITFSEFYIFKADEFTNKVLDYAENVKAYTDIELSQAEEIAAIEKQLKDSEMPVFYEKALAAIEDGASYRIFATVDGTKYYLTADGKVTSNELKANTFTFAKVAGVQYEYGFILDNGGSNCFSNPLNTNEESLKLGSINNNGSKRSDWDAQVFFLKDGKYAVRSTNAAGATSGWGWVGSAYWTVEEADGEIVAQYDWDPQFIFEVEPFTDNRKEAFEKIGEWVVKIQDANGLVKKAEQYISNAKDPAEGSYEALLDYDYTTFFHSTWHSDNDPGEDHYLQAELPNGAQQFYVYFKKRSQNNNNRPTEIVISASNDGENFTEIKSITEGLPTGATPIDYISELIDLGEAYKYIRFTVPSTNNGAVTGEHVFFTFSEFYLLPASDLMAEIMPYLQVADYTDLTFEDVDKINALDEEVINATTRTIESDLTSQFSALTVASNWKNIDGGNAAYTATQFCPAVTTNAGQTVQVCEYYRGSCDYTGEVLSQTISDLIPGTYRFELYGAAAFTFGRGFGSTAFTGDLFTDANAEFAAGDKIEENTGVTLYAETSEGTYGGEIPIYYATDFPNGASIVVLDGVVVGEDGKCKIGMSKTSTSTNWHVIQLKGVTAIAKFADVAAAAEADFEAVTGKVMETGAAEAMATAKAAFDAEDSDENLIALQAAVAAAKVSAEAYATAGAALEAMKALIDATNFYTEEAYNEYYGTPKAAYDARTLTTAEAAAIQNPNVVTGWRAALTVDNFLLSVWDAEPDFASSYYINSWSVEGDNDGTGFHVPFFEYWTGDGDSLGEKELTATIEGLEPGNYGVSVWARVRVKNNEYMEDAHGITFVANDGEPVDVTAGDIVAGSQFRLAKFTANGVVAEDGVLTVKFIVDADNDISWLSFKNVNYTLLKSDITSLSGEFAEVNNAKLAKQWVSNGDPAFELSCPLNFMTAAGLEGGAWNSVSDIIDDPYIGFYSNGDENCYFAVSAPNGIKITSLVFNASALKGAPTLYADGIDPVELTVAEQEITIPYDNVPVAKFHVGGEVAWMKATITVNYLAAAGAQSTPIATGVNTVKTVAAPAAIYNIAGQRVNNAVKGIYIINGKKVVK